MKKKRILLGAFLAVISLTVSACDFLPEGIGNIFQRSSSEESSSRRIRSGRTNSSTEHVHKFSDEWDYNDNYHWHNSICGHDVKSDYGPHDLYSAVNKQPTCTEPGERVDICKACDYRIITPISPVEHQWVEYERTEPTCYTEGLSKVYCRNCGEFDEIILPQIEHQFTVVDSRAPTCSVPGYQKAECSICGEMFYNEIPTLEHEWLYNSYVEPVQEGTVGYKSFTCSNCGATRIEIRALDGTTSGGFKTTDHDYMKLASNDQSISYYFNYPNSGYGTLYQHAMIDQNPGSFEYRTYQSVATGATCPYNFEININGSVVDLSSSSNITYGEFFENGEEIEGLSYNGFSLAADCLVGNVSLQAGLNTMTYSRLSSYSFCIDYFVLVINNSDHVHTPSSYWDNDDTYHWHNCTDSSCPYPQAKIDYAYHTFSDPVVLTEPTCSTSGVQYQTCSVCGYQKYSEIPYLNHDWDEGVFYDDYMCYEVNTVIYTCRVCGAQSTGTSYRDHVFNGDSFVTGVNSHGYAYYVSSCQHCNKTVTALPITSCPESESISSGKIRAGSTLTYMMPAIQTGWVGIYLPCRMSTDFSNKMFDPSLYEIQISGTFCGIKIPYCTYGDLGLTIYDNRYFQFAEYYITDENVSVGEIEISFTSNVSEYRLSFDGEIRVEY